MTLTFLLIYLRTFAFIHPSTFISYTYSLIKVSRHSFIHLFYIFMLTYICNINVNANLINFLLPKKWSRSLPLCQCLSVSNTISTLPPPSSHSLSFFYPPPSLTLSVALSLFLFFLPSFSLPFSFSLFLLLPPPPPTLSFSFPRSPLFSPISVP